MSNTDYAALNKRFAIPGQLDFAPGPGGLAVAEVSNAHASAMIALQGAHVMTWAPRKQQPVIWLSKAAKFAPGKSIRGGVPICWPWFGPHATEAKFPGHGFARTVMWEAVKTETLRDGATRLTFRILQDDATRAQWPHASEAYNIVTIGRSLDIELVTRNTGSAAITLGDAFHTYFEVGDIRRCTIHGLGNCPYLDKVDGGKKKQQTGPVTLDGEVDRIYLDSTADVLIDDPGLNRRIRVSKRGSRSTVVWNPGIEKAAKMGDFGDHGHLNMVCVESTNAAVTLGDAFHTYFEVGDVRRCTIHGLGNCPYLDKVDGGKKKQQTGPVTIDGEVDRIYLDSIADVLIDDPGLNRRIRVSKRGSRSTVVWNPGVEKAAKMGDFGDHGHLNMVCVESTNAADDVVQIPAGGEHHLWVRYSVEPLG